MQAGIYEQCGHHSEGVTGTRCLWLAPVSPGANEIWIFWEKRKMLFSCMALGRKLGIEL